MRAPTLQVRPEALPDDVWAALNATAVAEGVLAFLTGFVVVFLLGRYVAEPVIDAGLKRKQAFTDRSVRSVVMDVVDVGVIVVAAWTGLHLAGLGGLVSATAALGAAGTIVVGVAAQDALGNLTNGFVMAADPEFEVGDWVEWEDNEGEVVDIGLRATRIRTFRDRLVTVPNRTLANAALVNHSTADEIRAELTVGVGYEEDVAAVRETLLEVAAALDGVVDDPEPGVLVVDYGDSALTLELVYWVAAEDRPAERAVASQLSERVLDRLHEESVSMPGPHRELSGELTIEEGETGDEGTDPEAGDDAADDPAAADATGATNATNATDDPTAEESP